MSERDPADESFARLLSSTRRTGDQVGLGLNLIGPYALLVGAPARTEATRVGLRMRAVVEPTGHYWPFLAGVSNLGLGSWYYLCLGGATA